MSQKTKLETATEDFQRANYGQRFVGASLSQIELPERQAKLLSDWLNKPKNFLVFAGNPGIGKTYFCSAVTEWMISKFQSYRYHREEDLLRRLRHLINENGGDYSKEIELLCDDEFIILDDVGSGIDYSKSDHKNFEWRAEVFFTFLDYRYRTTKPTIITSNFTKDVFLKIYSPRVESRLYAAENTIIEITNIEDKRKKGL